MGRWLAVVVGLGVAADAAAQTAARGGRVHGMDHRYCIDNGAMIAHAGLLQYQFAGPTEMAKTDTTQRFRTDEVIIKWRRRE